MILVRNQIYRGSKKEEKENHIEDKDRTGIPDPEQFWKVGKP